MPCSPVPLLVMYTLPDFCDSSSRGVDLAVSLICFPSTTTLSETAAFVSGFCPRTVILSRSCNDEERERESDASPGELDSPAWRAERTEKRRQDAEIAGIDFRYLKGLVSIRPRDRKILLHVIWSQFDQEKSSVCICCTDCFVIEPDWSLIDNVCIRGNP